MCIPNRPATGFLWVGKRRIIGVIGVAILVVALVSFERGLEN